MAVSALTVGVGARLGDGFTSTTAGAMVTGALMGAGAAALNTGLTNLVMGRSFETGILQSAMMGAGMGAIAAVAKFELGKIRASNLAAKKTEALEMEVNPKEENIAYLADYDPIIDGPYSDDGPGQSYGGPGKAKPPGQYAKDPNLGTLSGNMKLRYPEFSEMYPIQKLMLNLSKINWFQPKSTAFPGIDRPVPSENPRRNRRMCGWQKGLYWLPPFWGRGLNFWAPVASSQKVPIMVMQMPLRQNMA